MRRPLWPRPHPFEAIFGAFLLVTVVRLWAAGAVGLGLEFLGMVAVIGLAAAVADRWPGTATARVRLLVSPVLVNVVYAKLGTVVARLGSPMRDDALLGADRALWGETPSVALGGWNHPVMTEILSGCYLLFFPAVLTAFVVAILRPEPGGVRLFNGLIGVYALGFLGYTLVPAAGPHLAWPELFPSPLTGGVLTRANAGLVELGSNRVDVFPSLHVAVTGFLMGSLRRRRRLFLVLLLPAAGLAAATLYLRYHYAADVAAGLLLAGVGLWLERLPERHHESDPSL